MRETVHKVVSLGDRLDHYLAASRVCTSRSEAKGLIERGCVRLNQAVTRPSDPVKTGDLVEIDWPPLKPTELVPHRMDLEILYEDRHLLVVNKPAGLAVHPGAGNEDHSLVHGLLYHCRDLSGIGGVERPGIVHRLDKGTSGLMVVAKDDTTHQALTRAFQGRAVEKEYRALCLGGIAWVQKTVRTLIKRSETNRKKFVVNQKKGKEAISHVTVLQQNTRLSLVSIKIDTGRTHQIRVHLAWLGHPVMGDPVYGGTGSLKGFDAGEQAFIKALGHQLLHAQRLAFVHPVGGKALNFECEPPVDFKAATERFL